MWVPTVLILGLDGLGPRGSMSIFNEQAIQHDMLLLNRAGTAGTAGQPIGPIWPVYLK